jgi:8-oxo-dGTP pyrophosphatase MutT (NUDIX family)
VNDFLPLPAAMVRRAREFRGEPATARPAATVVLLRQGTPGLQVYVLRRLAAMVFGGVYAFPGGSVDPSDGPPGLRPDWPRRLGLPAQAAGAVVGAAVREIFEETGVLLAVPDGADHPVEAVEDDRTALTRRETTLSEVLARRGLRAQDELLGPWSRWITPEFEPRRFDTFFFVAALPAGQAPRDVSGEADRTMWVTPAEALAGYAAGSLSMLPPTVATLRDLAGYERVEDVVAAAARREVVRPIVPRVEPTPDGGAVLRIAAPPDDGTPGAQESTGGAEPSEGQPKRPVM